MTFTDSTVGQTIGFCRLPARVAQAVGQTTYGDRLSYRFEVHA
jgi:hypothetical protein